MGCDMLTQQQLKQHLSYDPETGIFVRANNVGRFKAGQVLGTKHSTGYSVIRINGKLYKAHRLAWLYVYGSFPESVIDHINRDGFDNRLINLRLATQRQNCENHSLNKNNTSGYLGVDWSKKLQKWRARITQNFKGIHLGYFDNIDDAHQAYRQAATIYHTNNPLSLRVNT